MSANQMGKEDVAELKAELRYDRVRSDPTFPVDNVREIWLNVADKLAHQDKLTFLTTFPEWHEWLESKRNLFLFQEIAPIILNGLSKAEALQSRQLCQQWTKELDKQHHSSPDLLRLTFENDNFGSGPQFSHYIIYFSKTEDIQRFMEKSRTDQGNPFPGRSLKLKWRWAPAPDHELGPFDLRFYTEYWAEMSKMLSSFGTHVHFCKIKTSLRYNFTLHEIDGLEKLRNCLLHLPHLKRLNIQGLSGLSLEQVENYFEENPLPRLVDLETLIICMSAHLMDAILRACAVPSKIKRLRFVMEYSSKDLLRERLQKFTNLEVLSVFCGRIDEVARFSWLPKPPPLTHLNLRFWHEDPTAKELFVALEPFGNTPVHFKMSSNLLMYYVSAEYVNLPSLERLHLEECEGLLDFIVHLKALSFLRVDEWIPPKDRMELEGAVIDIYGFEERMYESNIWELIPSLKTVIIGMETYERHSYEQL